MSETTAPILASDDPRKEVRVGLVISAIFFIGVLGWAAFIPVDAAVYAGGEIEVVGNRQSVQHPEGGVVAALNVKEGDKVQAGQVLLVLGSPQVVAEERSLASQAIALMAVRSRLLAERDGRAMTTPPEFAALTGQDAAEAAAVLAQQRNEITVRRSAIGNERSVYGQQRSQLHQQIEGYQRQLAANAEQQRLLGQELESFRILAAKGTVSQNYLRERERSMAALQGSEGEYRAMIARAQEAIGQVELQSVGLDRQQQQQIAEQLRQVEADLGEVAPRWQAALNRRQSTEIRAPATGKVVGLSVFTVGGVVSGGQVLMDIVPDSSALTVVVQVSPADADDLRAGQDADVRFAGLTAQRLPQVKGKVTEISADSFLDEATQLRFFRAEIEVAPQEWQTLTSQGVETELRPGLPAEVIIPLRKRTALQYIFEPLSRNFWRSFREH